MTTFTKVLVANRGEIAVRIFRTLRELGLESVAVYSEADRNSLHVDVADEAFLIGPGLASESYLVHDRIIQSAKAAGAGAIHPGYGFLAENAAFARRCEQEGIVWIGPPASAIDAMGSKVASRELMVGAGVPVVPGTTEPVTTVEEVIRLGEEIGWPLAIKASAGGGGKGLKVIDSAEEAERALSSAMREGEAYFADATVYIEKYLIDPRHVEVQILADNHGAVVHLGERDCTIQRRHQKIVEETPSPAVDDALRERIGEIAVNAARATGYRSAGTIEGLLDRDGNYYFLEMNTRIQVEHTITEMVTGIDLVREQIAIAQDEPLPFSQDDIEFRGHAFECRVNAEDPSSGFLPTPGVITQYQEPAGPGVRIDSGVRAGSEVVGIYDPLIAKLCVWDTDRERARHRMLRALGEFTVVGISTLIGFHRALLTENCFIAGETCHGLVESPELAARAEALTPGPAASNTATPGATHERSVVAEVDGKRYDVKLVVPEPPYLELARQHAERLPGSAGNGTQRDAVTSPMQGTVLAVEVANGDAVTAGQVLCVVEAMKMENEIKAHRDGTVANVSVEEGASVSTGQVICVVSDPNDVTNTDAVAGTNDVVSGDEDGAPTDE